MSYSAETYQKALEIIKERKEKNEKLAEERQAILYAKYPKYDEVSKALRRTAIRGARLATDFNSEGLLKLKAEFSRLTKEKQDIIKELGIEEVTVKYNCAICNDTGFVDGLLCECAKAEARNIEYARLSKVMPLEDSTFSGFSLDYYKSEDKKKMEKIFDTCKQYANEFSQSSGNLLFLGRTGLGKTHLSLAIAGSVIAKGFGVVYCSAQTLLSQLEKEHFGREENNYTENVCECDLLIIDDLGAEFSTQFTQASLYNIINTRMQSAKPIIISSNLEAEQLKERYGERIMSRIIGSFSCFRFVGNDIRQLKRMENS